MADVNEIEAALTYSRDELFEQLGASDDPMFATPEARRERGQAFYRNLLEGSRQAICANAEVKAYLGDGRHTLKVQAVAAIVDLLGGKGAVACAVLIVQTGLGEICRDEWRSAI